MPVYVSYSRVALTWLKTQWKMCNWSEATYLKLHTFNATEGQKTVPLHCRLRHFFSYNTCFRTAESFNFLDQNREFFFPKAFCMEPKGLKKHSTKLWISGFLKVKQAGNSLAERQYVKVLMKMTFRVNGQLKWLTVLLVTGLQNKWKLPVKNMQHISLYFFHAGISKL